MRKIINKHALVSPRKLTWQEKYIFDFEYEMCEDGGVLIQKKAKPLIYVLGFIPVHLYELTCCLLNGGLKEFVIQKRDMLAPTLCYQVNEEALQDKQLREIFR